MTTADAAGRLPRLVLRLHIPRADELPVGLSRCGGWGEGTVMYASDRHCGQLTTHSAHLVPVGPVVLTRGSLLQLLAGTAQTGIAAPTSVQFDETRAGQPLVRVQLPDGEQTAVAVYAHLFGLPGPDEIGWIGSSKRGARAEFVAENGGGELFCGWRVWVSCFLPAGEVTG